MNTLVTEDGDLGGGKFLCPRTHRSFRLDVFTHAVDNVSPLQPDDGDGGSVKLEPWRVAIETAMTHYMGQNFPHGAVSVFAPCKNKNNCIVVYIESSFQKTRLYDISFIKTLFHISFIMILIIPFFWSSGRWRSRWTLEVPSGKIEGETCKVSGEIRIQVCWVWKIVFKAFQLASKPNVIYSM